MSNSDGPTIQDFDDHDDSVSDAEARALTARTWETSLDLLNRRGLPQARPLLRLFSVFAAAPVPYQALNPAIMASSSLFVSLDVIRLQRLLDSLTGLGLLDRADSATPPSRDGPAALRMHPLIRDASRHRLRSTGQMPPLLALAARLLDQATDDSGRPDDPATWPILRLLAPHPLHVLTTAANTPTPDADTIDHVTRTALRVTGYVGTSGLYSPALTQAKTIHDMACRLLGVAHPTVLKARDVLANSTGMAGDPVDARDQLAALLPSYNRVVLKREGMLDGQVGDLLVEIAGRIPPLCETMIINVVSARMPQGTQPYDVSVPAPRIQHTSRAGRPHLSGGHGLASQAQRCSLVP